jgi:type IV secretory pathway VirB2 component (pilin)
MRLLSLLVLFVISFAALAQGEVIVPPTGDELVKLLQSIGGAVGAGTLAIVAVVVQGVLLFFRSSFAKFAGIWQLVIVNGLTLAVGVVALKAQGVEWSAALLHSQTLAALQVLVHQVWKQLSKPA